MEIERPIAPVGACRVLKVPERQKRFAAEEVGDAALQQGLRFGGHVGGTSRLDVRLETRLGQCFVLAEVALSEPPVCKGAKQVI